MRKILMVLAAAALALPLSAAQPAKKTAKVKKQNKKEVKASKKWNHEQVVELITKVNNYWQANNKPEVRAFWDNAAYHTGNMEVYKMLKDQKMLDYSIRWAEHNDWTGATEANPAKWKYKPYGEGKDHVLFGDWQICFQTYIDLYNIEAAKGNAAASEFMVKRAKETNLYFRDGKYIYPKHKSANGKIDFFQDQRPAVQPDGKVGYVQPIGERAIPGQTVDANSQANFGVGAMLLTACEYDKYLAIK